jgi:NAD(P)-dependent dehydrogenase (short-subunit alcohol dehydrogenase family)
VRRPSPTGRWTADEVGDQTGRTVVITGGNTGIGFEAAAVLLARGAAVVLACRDQNRVVAAVARLADAVPGAAVSHVLLDLSSLASVRQGAETILSRHPRIDLLINNAGVMMTPQGRTKDGHELQFGVNHLGHFALTGLLLDRLLGTPGSRVVNVSSSAHRQGSIDFTDLNYERRAYGRTTAYMQSKLANVLFTYELQRRLSDAAAGTVAVALEPGIIRTELPRYLSGPMALGVAVMTRLVGQPGAEQGALATLRAATDPAVQGGEYFAPDGWLRASGHPAVTASSPRSHDVELQRRLWMESERLTGVSFPLPVATA